MKKNAKASLPDKTKAVFSARPVIYQMLPRLFANKCDKRVPNGDIHTNGSGKLNDITPAVLKSIKGLGATHVWYTGIVEHAQCSDYTRYGIRRDNPYIVKGKAGSPYAIKDWYDIDPDVAENVPERMAEFEALVARTHKAGLKVITDLVPNHVARQYHSDSAPAGVSDFGRFDDTDVFFTPDNNFYYIPRQRFSPSIPLGSGKDEYVEFPAKCTGNDCYTAYPSANDWYETVKLNYGYDPGNRSTHFWPIPRTWNDMLKIMIFWASKGIDGLRCDMVHMVPVEFWQWAIPQVKARYPELIFIAEIYDVALYRDYINRGGFDYLYDKVTLYDTLRGIDTAGTSAAQLTSCWQTVEGISGNMLNFLENHDEQRYASRQYMGRPDTVLPALVAIATINTGAVMIYMGQELGESAPDAEGFSGQDGRTTIFDYWSLDCLQRWLGPDFKATGSKLFKSEKQLRDTYASVLALVNGCEAVRNGSFFDLTYANYHNERFNPHRHFAYLRRSPQAGSTVLVVLNFNDETDSISVNIPRHAFDCLGILPRTGIDARNLLTGSDTTINFTDAAPTPVTVPAHGAIVLEFKD